MTLAPFLPRPVYPVSTINTSQMVRPSPTVNPPVVAYAPRLATPSPAVFAAQIAKPSLATKPDPAVNPSTSEEPPRKKSRVGTADYGLKTITVRVYETEDESSKPKEFIVHENLVRKVSPFFEAALSGNWKESEDRVLDLHNVHPDGFDTFVRWVYSGSIFSTRAMTCDTGAAKIAEQETLVRAYLAGDILLSTEFKDRVMDTYRMFLKVAKRMPCSFLIKPVWEATTASSPLRELMLDYFVGLRGISVSKHERLAIYPAGFLFEAWVKFKGEVEKCGNSDSIPKWNTKCVVEREACYYHEHKKQGQPCYKSTE